MFVYYILLLVPLVMQHFTINWKNVSLQKKNRDAMLFFFVVLTILLMLRHKSVGTDTMNYISIFERFSAMAWTQVGTGSIEFGFSYYAKIVSLFFNNYQVFFAVTAIVTAALIYPTYKRLCVDASLTIVMYVTMSTFVMAFSGIKQMLAVGIGFVAYECTRQKKLVLFIMCVILAITFHTSAFMLAFMYPLYHAKITRKWLYVVVPTMAVVFIFNKQIFSVLSVIIERYTEYDANTTQTGAYTMIILFTLFTVFSFLIPEESYLDDETIGLRNFLILSLVIQMFAPLHTIAMRMSYYYIIFIPLLLPKIIEYRSDRWKQVAIVGRHVMVIFFLLYFFLIKANSAGNLKVFPYHFFLQDHHTSIKPA